MLKLKPRVQSGIAHLGLILLVLVLVVAGAVGWYVWDKNKTDEQKPSISNFEECKAAPGSTVQESFPEVCRTEDGRSFTGPSVILDKTYTDAIGKFTLKYPSAWKSQTKLADFMEGLKISDGYITSPKGTKIIVKTDYGGRGAYCEPGKNDKPYDPDNDCATFEYKSAEAIGVNALQSKDVSTAEDLKNDEVEYAKVETPIYLVEEIYNFPARYQAESGYLYSVSLAATTYRDINNMLNKPQMGAWIPGAGFTNERKDESKSVNIYVYAESKAKNFFTSAEGTAVKDILRTFRFTN